MELSKENLKNYTIGKYDLTIENIAKEFNTEMANIDTMLKPLLKELEDDEWINKYYCKTHEATEYEPGGKQKN